MKILSYTPVHLKTIIVIFIIVLTSCTKKETTVQSPNVIVIMTDDQGIGDFGFMGNPYIKTPHLDKLASQSLSLTNFYVSPVCAPTRACLMTGRYSERTGVYDTYNGGAIMSDEEITMAEVFSDNGYKTGIFGKWHLGDNYPYRPMDQGFDVSVVHRAGGVGQPGDILNFYAGDSSYFNPALFKNGEPVQTQGYCSDVYTSEAIDFILANRKEGQNNPFFAYLSFNAPHTPLQLPQEYYDLYKDLRFNADSFEIYDEIVEKMSSSDIEAAKRVYGMVTNIDDNIGRLLKTLKEESLLDNTIIVFLTDNGPQQNRYKLGLRERKSSVYGGGVRVPCLIHYPEKFKGNEELEITAAHIDLLPSLVDLCGITGISHPIDGLSFFDANRDNTEFENRTLFFEWGRGYLMKYRNFSALKGSWKLVGNTGKESEIESFNLFNIIEDPGEKNNILAQHMDKAESLKEDMDDWYDEIVSEKNNNKTFPSYIGTPYENPVLLNRNDAKGTPVAWRGDNNLNYWEIRAPEGGTYDITLHFLRPVQEIGRAVLRMYPYHMVEENRTKGIESWTFHNVKINAGDYIISPYYQIGNRNNIFPFYVSVMRTDK